MRLTIRWTTANGGAGRNRTDRYRTALQAAARASENRAEVLPAGLEPAISAFGGQCPIRLDHESQSAPGWTRTIVWVPDLQSGAVAAVPPTLGVTGGTRTLSNRLH